MLHRAEERDGKCATLALMALTSDDSIRGASGSAARSVGRGEWNSVHCYSLLPTVCEAPLAASPLESSDSDTDGSGLTVSLDRSTQPRNAVSQGSSSYFLYDGVRLSWEDAKAFCASRHAGGRLPTLGSQSEAAAVLSLLGNVSYWIGLSDEATEGSFEWDDGAAGRLLPWISSENVSYGQSAANDCVAVTFSDPAAGWSGSFSFAVRQCGDVLPYICSVSDGEDVTAAAAVDRFPVVLRRQGSATYASYEYLLYRAALYDNSAADQVSEKPYTWIRRVRVDAGAYGSQHGQAVRDGLIGGGLYHHHPTVERKGQRVETPRGVQLAQGRGLSCGVRGAPKREVDRQRST